MDIETGNANDIDTQRTGWFIGFSPWARGLRHVPKEQIVTGLCVKWFHHAPGHAEDAKPVSTGRTMSALVTQGGHFELDFCERADFTGEVRTVAFKREGDFAIWGEGLHHRWRCVREATIATVRWMPA